MAEELAYEVLGQGKPLVCLHAYALDHTVWIEVANLLQPKYMVILPDLRGHGRSPTPADHYTMQEMAEDVTVLLEKLGIKQAFFAGHSMGGYVMLSLAKHYPEYVLGLALVASHAFADSPEKKKSRLEDIELVKLKGPAAVLTNMPKILSDDRRIQKFCKDKVEQMEKDGVIGALGAMADREDSIRFLKEFKKPLGIIVGKQDNFIPLEMSRSMAELLKPTVYIELENCGHMPMMESPIEVANALETLFHL